MPIYVFAINSNKDSLVSENEPANCLARYDIDAPSEKDARGLGFTRFCKENPELSHNINEYTISVGC